MSPTLQTGNGHAAQSRDPDRIETEVEEARARLSLTLDEIRERMSPGQILDQVLDYGRDSGGGQFARTLGRQVRDNPLPVLLIGAGISWLMAADRGGRAADATTAAPASGPSLGDRAQAVADSMGRSAGSARSAAADGVSAASARVSAAASAAGERLSSAADGIGSGAARIGSGFGDAVHGVGSGANAAARRASDMGGDAGRAMARLADEQPLVVGAIGLAIGAALGALLPTSRTEHRVMGAAADRVKDGAASLASDLRTEASSMASEAAREVKDTLAERGVTPEAVRETAGAVAGRVRETAVGSGEGGSAGQAGQATDRTPT